MMPRFSPRPLVDSPRAPRRSTYPIPTLVPSRSLPPPLPTRWTNSILHHPQRLREATPAWRRCTRSHSRPARERPTLLTRVPRPRVRASLPPGEPPLPTHSPRLTRPRRQAAPPRTTAIKIPSILPSPPLTLRPSPSLLLVLALPHPHLRAIMPPSSTYLPTRPHPSTEKSTNPFLPSPVEARLVEHPLAAGLRRDTRRGRRSWRKPVVARRVEEGGGAAGSLLRPSVGRRRTWEERTASLGGRGGLGG